MFIFTFMMRKNRVAISILSQRSAHYQTFLDAYVEEGGRKGREATVSSDSLNIVMKVSINHLGLGVVNRTRILVSIIVWEEVGSGDGQ